MSSEPSDTASSLAVTRTRVTDELREQIISGRLKPGDRLVEREVADELGVSRVPVREAIRSLQAEGFVVASSPRRMVVRQLSQVDVEELFDVREALEVHAAGMAAKRADRAGLARLRHLLDHAAAVTEAGRAEEITVTNSRFHDEIIALAGNGLLSSMLAPLQGRLRWLTRQNENWDDLLAEHRRLYEAIASGDDVRAKACALEHVRENRAITLRALFAGDV